MLGGLAKKWGFGVEFTFAADAAIATMARVRHSLGGVKAGMQGLQEGGGSVLGGVGALAAGMAPLTGGLALALGYASQLSAQYEDQKLTFDVMLGSQAKAAELMDSIVKMAETTPFEQSDLIDAGKNFLIITNRNIEKTKELTHLAGTLAAVNEGMTASEAAHAIVRATMGEFDPLESLGIGGMKVSQFSKFGDAGGEAFKAAVLDAIQLKADDLTGGVDIMALKSKTQSGSLSNVQDAVSTILRLIGDEIKPARMAIQQLLIDAFTAAKGPAVAAFRDLWRDVVAVVEGPLTAIRDRLAAWWGSLGEEGQAGVFKIAIALMAAATAATGFALGAMAAIGVLGAIGMVIGGLGTMAAALGAMLSEAWILVIPLALGAVAAFMALGAALGGLWASGGDGAAYMVSTWQILSSVLGDVWGALVAFGSAFRRSVLHVLGEFADVWGAELKPAMLGLWDALLLLVGEFRDGGRVTADYTKAGAVLGWLMADVLIPGLTYTAFMLTNVAKATTWAVRMFATGITWARSFAVALFGVADGSLSIPEAMQLMAVRTLQIMATLVRSLVATVLTGVQGLLGALAGAVAFLPGGGAIAEMLNAGAAGLGTIGGALDQQFIGAISSLDAKGNEIEATRRDRAEKGMKIDGVIENTVIVEMDGREVAKTQGKQAINDGESGKKAKMPPDQRGRVLRNGLEITPLRAGEVL